MDCQIILSLGLTVGTTRRSRVWGSEGVMHAGRGSSIVDRLYLCGIRVDQAHPVHVFKSSESLGAAGDRLAVRHVLFMALLQGHLDMHSL